MDGLIRQWGRSSTHLSCFRAYSNILILLTRSFFKFSWPFLSPCKKAIWAWKHKNRIVRSGLRRRRWFTIAKVINRSTPALMWHLWRQLPNNKDDLRSDSIWEHQDASERKQQERCQIDMRGEMVKQKGNQSFSILIWATHSLSRTHTCSPCSSDSEILSLYTLHLSLVAGSSCGCTQSESALHYIAG